jgi:hypothetical protein
MQKLNHTDMHRQPASAADMDSFAAFYADANDWTPIELPEASPATAAAATGANANAAAGKAGKAGKARGARRGAGQSARAAFVAGLTASERAAMAELGAVVPADPAVADQLDKDAMTALRAAARRIRNRAAAHDSRQRRKVRGLAGAVLDVFSSEL